MQDKISDAMRERIAAMVREKIDVVPYDPKWPYLFVEEAAHLRTLFGQYYAGDVHGVPKPLSLLPPPEGAFLRRIEHFGSTAVPGLAAKPVIDMLVEVSSYGDVERIAVPALTAGPSQERSKAGSYDYFWRPEFGDDGYWYAWFVKRGADGRRTHHIHMVERGAPLWDRLAFRDYLRAHPGTAAEYGRLKSELAAHYPNDREAYTKGKDDFIREITERAKR